MILRNPFTNTRRFFILTPLIIVCVVSFTYPNDLHSVPNHNGKQTKQSPAKKTPDRIKRSNLKKTVTQKVKPQNVKTKNAESEKLYRQSLTQDDEAAIRTLLNAEKINPNDTQVLYRLGFLFHKKSRLPEAKKYYLATVQKSKCSFHAYNNLGTIALDTKDYTSSEKYLNSSIKCNPNSYIAYYNMGNLKQAAKNEKDAERYYKLALTKNKNHYRSHHNLGMIYYREANRFKAKNTTVAAEYYSRAMQHLESAVRLAPNDPVGRYAYSSLLYDRGFFEDALKQSNEAVRLSTNRTEYSAVNANARKKTAQIERRLYDKK